MRVTYLRKDIELCCVEYIVEAEVPAETIEEAKGLILEFPGEHDLDYHIQSNEVLNTEEIGDPLDFLSFGEEAKP